MISVPRRLIFNIHFTVKWGNTLIRSVLMTPEELLSVLETQSAHHSYSLFQQSSITHTKENCSMLLTLGDVSTRYVILFDAIQTLMFVDELSSFSLKQKGVVHRLSGHLSIKLSSKLQQ